MKSSKPDFIEHIRTVLAPLPEPFFGLSVDFCTSVLQALPDNTHREEMEFTLLSLSKMVVENFKQPYTFEPFHKHVLSPFNYYTFGLNLIRPLVDFKHSFIRGLDALELMASALSQGENVVLFANHQIEADPQAISLMLEKIYPAMAQDMIFVAGERVLTDPMAIPLSMGRNLLCIYSKKYIDHPPEKQLQKQLHNKNTMLKMSTLLQQGGHIIYVAPSGGRDRPGPSGLVEIAPFDPQSIEMFYLMAKRAKTKTHFHTLALSTYDLMPPPNHRHIGLGEERSAKFSPIRLHFGREIDMEAFSADNKHDLRFLRCQAIEHEVKEHYKALGV